MMSETGIAKTRELDLPEWVALRLFTEFYALAIAYYPAVDLAREDVIQFSEDFYTPKIQKDLPELIRAHPGLASAIEVVTKKADRDYTALIVPSLSEELFQRIAKSAICNRSSRC